MKLSGRFSNVIIILTTILLLNLLLTGVSYGTGAPGTVTSGTVTGCISIARDSTSLKIGGRSVSGKHLLVISADGTCPAGETSLTLFNFTRAILVNANGTATQNGDALWAAVDKITTLSPTANNPYLLKLEPGKYDIGNRMLVLPQFVDLEGSGEGLTEIISSVGFSSGGNPTIGALKLSGYNEVRFLSVSNTGAASTQVGIISPVGPSGAIFLLHVTAKATASGVPGWGRGMFTNNAQVNIVDCDLSSTGNGTNANPGSSAGLSVWEGQVTVRGSRISGGIYSATSYTSPHGMEIYGAQVTISDSLVAATGGSASNSITSLQVFDGAGTDTSSNVTINNSELSMVGGYNIGIGLSQDGGTVTVNSSNLQAQKDQGTTMGVRIQNNGKLTLNNSSVNGKTLINGFGYGLYNNGGTVTINNSVFSAGATGAGNYSYALYNSSTAATTLIHNSRLLATGDSGGSGYALYPSSGSMTVGASAVTGSGATVWPGAGGTLSCVGDWKESGTTLVALGANCL